MKKIYALLVIALAGLVISITAPQSVEAAVSSVQAGSRRFFSGITTFAAQLKISNGTAAEPSIVFTSDDDTSGTGIYRVGANDLGISTNGTLRVDVSTAAVTSTLPLAITTTGTVLTLGTGSDTVVHSVAINDGTLGDYEYVSGYQVAAGGNGFGASSAATPAGNVLEAVLAASGVQLTNDTAYKWVNSSTNAAGAAADTGLSQCGAGIVCVGTGADNSAAGTLSATSTVISSTVMEHTYHMTFCGQGPNGATAVYLSPRSSGLWGDATCDAEDNTTEATADEVLFPYDIKVGSMQCGLNDVAADATGVTFSLRDDTADVGTNMSCVTGALDASGFNSCSDQTTVGAAYTIAAGSAIAMKAVAATGNESTADIWCDVQYTK